MPPEPHEDPNSDLGPDALAGTGDDPVDVLADWDLVAARANPGRDPVDRRPFPTDTVVVAVAVLLGLVLGGRVRRRPARLRSAILGASGGAVTAGLLRRIWRAPG